jgi:hypothetical protein
VSLLTSEFLVLSGYIVASIQVSIGQSGSDGADAVSIQESRLQSLDLLLPRVAEALILVTQCLTTIFLHVEKDAFPKELGDEIRKVVRQARHNVDKGVIEELIGSHIYDPLKGTYTHSKIQRLYNSSTSSSLAYL